MKARCIVMLWGARPELYFGSLSEMLDYARSQNDTGLARIEVFNPNGDRVYCKLYDYTPLACCTSSGPEVQ